MLPCLVLSCPVWSGLVWSDLIWSYLILSLQLTSGQVTEIGCSLTPETECASYQYKNYFMYCAVNAWVIFSFNSKLRISRYTTRYTCLLPHGPYTRYGTLRVAYAPGMTLKETASSRSRHASRHVRHARAVTHVGIANPHWRGKRSRHSRRNFAYLVRCPFYELVNWVVTGITKWLVLYQGINQTNA